MCGHDLPLTIAVLTVAFCFAVVFALLAWLAVRGGDDDGEDR